jgi:hypothetical protein
MKIKDAEEKGSSWWKNCREVLGKILPSYSKWILILSIIINVALVALIFTSLAFSLVAPQESGYHFISDILYKFNIEPTTVSLTANGIRSENIRIPGHLLQGWQASPEHISIDIKNNDFQWLSWQ